MVADLRDFLDAIAAKSSWTERMPNPRLIARRRARRAELARRAAEELLGVRPEWWRSLPPDRGPVAELHPMWVTAGEMKK